jgi:tetratricopeptide (TPR) repeat protein
VKKKQFILLTAGLALLMLVYFFGKTTPPKKVDLSKSTDNSQKIIDFATILKASKQKLSASQQVYLSGLEQAVVRGDVNKQQQLVYNQLATFWKDSARVFIPYAYYNGLAAKLENSEKSLTFAARIFLEELRVMDPSPVKKWMATEVKGLFEQALVINPDNDSLKIGLGSCFIFGSSADSPQEVMQGIQKILEVSKKDSANMYAQFMLGMGGVVSGQLDKAVERFNKVVKAEPENLEAILMMAETYERKGDNVSAINWYEKAKQYIANKKVVEEVDKRIKSLK